MMSKMKNTIYFTMFLMLFLSNCTKKNDIKIKEKQNDSTSFEQIEDIININQKQKDRSLSKIYSIKDIRDFIINDLNLKTRYNNIEELLTLLNITDNYTIEAETFNNIHEPETIDTMYIINSVQYKLEVFNNINVEYHLLKIEIELDINGYLDIFPYKTKNEYLESNTFGSIAPWSNSEDKIIYDIDGYSEFCILNFINNILKSISIIDVLD
jgi:hypothetical protein